MALDRDVAQALDLDAEHQQDRGDRPGPEERAMLAVGSVIRGPGALHVAADPDAEIDAENQWSRAL